MVFTNRVEGAKLIQSTTEFAFDVFKRLSADKDGGNVFLSPVSISMALAMTYVGARTKTAEQMSEVMKFVSVHPDYLHSSFSELRQSLVGSDTFALHVANKLYGHRQYNFLQEFLDSASNYYGAPLEKVDFAHDTEGSSSTINQWVASQTNNKIKNLLPQGSIDGETCLVLVNAIYFKGDWQDKFHSVLTQERNFVMADGTRVKVPMMHMREEDFNYGYSPDLNTKALELPYAGKKLSMIILLPEHPSGISALERDLTPKHVVELERHFCFRSVSAQVFLPRFKLEDSFDLCTTLSDMGMQDAFRPALADFSGMDGSCDLHISKVVHKAFVEVNEEGTEAAAATAVGLIDYDAAELFLFNADHPFVFLVRDIETRAILFFGKFASPS